VPPHLRVLFGNFVGFLWSIYLANLMAKQAKAKKDQDHNAE
jgi:Mpv17 / PMP22 family